MRFLQLLFLAIFISCSLLSCEQNATPVIYPAKEGVDPAYANLLHVKKVEKLEFDLLPSKPKKKKIIRKIIKIQPKKTTQLVDRIVPFSKDNTQDTLKITYAKANKKVTKKVGQTNTFVFNTDTAKKVAIKISAKDTLANLRINHIKGPVDSIKGGPFGKTLIYDLPAKGNYNFSVSENPTNKTPYEGEYTIDLQLLWK